MRGLAAAMRRMNGSKEIPEMTPEVFQAKAKKLYDVVHIQPEARKTLFPEYLLVFSDGYDTRPEVLVRTMKNIRESLSDAAHKFILRNVFNGETNMSERQKFVDILDYMLEVAKSLTDISPDFNISFKEMQEILGKYPNDAQFSAMLAKIDQYTSESTQKKDALHDALEAARERAEALVDTTRNPIEEVEEPLRDAWDSLVTLLHLKKDDTVLLSDFAKIETGEKKVEETDISALVSYISDYIRSQAHRVLETLISQDIQEGIEEFDQRSEVKFRTLLVQGLSQK